MGKKYLALVMVLVLTIGGCVFAEGEATDEAVDEAREWVAFETPMTSILDRTASEWISSSKNRAMLSLTLTMDIIIDQQDEYIPDFGEVSYVGREGGVLILYVVLQTENTLEEKMDMFVLFDANTKEAEYSVHEHWEKLMVELFMEDICGEKWYENDQDDIVEVASALSDVMED